MEHDKQQLPAAQGAYSTDLQLYLLAQYRGRAGGTAAAVAVAHVTPAHSANGWQVPASASQ
jgi:hypothetical protein